MDRQTDGGGGGRKLNVTDGRTDGQTDRQTDGGHCNISIPGPSARREISTHSIQFKLFNKQMTEDSRYLWS